MLLTKSKRKYIGTSLGTLWLRIHLPDFPGGAVVRNPPANAGDTGLIPGLGRSYMPRSNEARAHNYWVCTLEPMSHNYWACMPQLLSPDAWSPCSATREATTMRSLHTAMNSSPRSLQLEKACTQQQRFHAAKNK